MYYTNIRTAIAATETEQIQKATESITNATVGNIRGQWHIKQYTTPAILRDIKNIPNDEKPSPEIVSRMIGKASRAAKKDSAKRLAKLEIVENTPRPEYITVNVEWVKNNTWGYNPHASVCGDRTRTFGTASGCGYDKQSAAIATACNENYEILRILYDHAENGGKFSYSVLSYAGMPYFDGGCGVSCFGPVFDECGYKWRCTGSGKTFDCYTAERKGE